MGHKLMLTLVSGLVVALGACSTGSERTAGPQPVTSAKSEASASSSSESSTSTTTIAPTTTAPRGPLGSGEPVRLAFAGDSSFQGLGSAVVNDPAGVLKAIAPILGDADLTMVNLEAALGSGGTPQDKAFKFQTPAGTLDALRAAGVDVVTMANNHGMDFGTGGLESTLAIKATGSFPIVGVGADATEAYAAHVIEVKGQRIGFMGVNDVFDASLQTAWTATDSQAGIASAKGANQKRLTDAVAATRKSVDTLVVYLHYGRETETCPNGRQKELASELVAAGADIVVGSHAHRLQGIGYMGPKLVAYGLGNFVFKPGSAVGRESGVLTVTATGSRIDGYEWHPAVIQGLVPVPLDDERGAVEMTKMATLGRCSGLSPEPTGAP